LTILTTALTRDRWTQQGYHFMGRFVTLFWGRGYSRYHFVAGLRAYFAGLYGP
jgi:hypothetical protein